MDPLTIDRPRGFGASPKPNFECISVYIHVPLCERKCPYCHFYVIQNSKEAQGILLEALFLELERVAPRMEGRRIVSVYFGGGTPFLLPAGAVDALLRKIPLAADCEVTVEANPEEVSEAGVRALADVGVNRLSMGVQSFDNALLRRLGRRHTAQRASKAVVEAKNGGIDNLSIDLMFDIPGQRLSSWEATLEAACALPITHLSLYNLTFEEKTPFARRHKELKPLLPSEEESLVLWERALEVFESQGFERYEISAFARGGLASRHNVGYWTARPFIGLGPSAFSYLEGKRTRNAASLTKYAASLRQGASPVDFEEGLSYPDDVHELLAIALRMTRGVDLEAFERRHAPLPSATHARVQELAAEGLLEYKKGHVCLTQRGHLFYDSVAERLI